MTQSKIVHIKPGGRRLIKQYNMGLYNIVTRVTSYNRGKNVSNNVQEIYFDMDWRYSYLHKVEYVIV